LRDFTIATYRVLISSLEEQGYRFYTFEQFQNEKPSKAVILRHDIDKRPEQAVLLAEFENNRSIRASYHIRALPSKGLHYTTFIKRIVELGHEIAYHYEDLSHALSSIKYLKSLIFRDIDYSKGIEQAKKSFISNLNWLREFYPVRVISMHGNPLSKFDNRMLWDYLNYRELGLICEPYLDINYDEVLYLTDTGRCWDALLSNRRDRILTKPELNSNNLQISNSPIQSTFDLIKKTQIGSLPEKLIINTHPQRWTDDKLLWLTEYIGQNFRNIIKAILFR
jgi:hypothetical protein